METLTVPLGRAAKYGQLTVECAKFAEHVNDHIYLYGLRQILNDAIADKDGLSDDEIRAKAIKRLDTLYSGELRVRNGAAEPADPIEAEYHRLVKRMFVAAYAGAKDVPKGTKDRALWCINRQRVSVRKSEVTWDEVCDTMRETPKGKALVAQAKKNVAETANVDLAGLGL